MKKYFSYILIIFLLTSFARDKEKREYIGGRFISNYEKHEGKIDGKYVSRYKNGRIRSVGYFNSNCRQGKWLVWDSTGKYCTERIYENLFSYKIRKPKLPKNELVDLLNVSIYDMKYNSKGFIDLFILQERAVYWEKRLWRFIPEKNNEILFNENSLINIINDYAFKDSIQLYKDDEFMMKLKYINFNNKKIIGYKIKEDSFFDTDRYLFETRILGICPVYIDNMSKDTTDLYWIYYPQIRQYLSTVIPSNFHKVSNVKTYDDIFLFRNFYSVIYKSGWVFNKVEKKDLIQKENEKDEIELIEKEHDLWLDFIR
jgi:hypothetical protein